nr:hypothetical protein MIMGU_mgv1a015239mg [Ipomoea batatas]
MSKGPSPLIPLLTVLTLGLLLHGETMMGYFSFALEDTSVSAVFFVFPVLAFLVVMYYTTQAIILPAITVLLVMYWVTKILLGPLFLVFLVCLAVLLGSSSSSVQWEFSYRSGVRFNGGRGSGDEFGGWGWWLLLLVAFLVLHGVFSFAEGNGWAFALLAVFLFVVYNFSNLND